MREGDFQGRSVKCGELSAARRGLQGWDLPAQQYCGWMMFSEV